MDLDAMAVRMGWMPFFPQFKEISLVLEGLDAFLVVGCLAHQPHVGGDEVEVRAQVEAHGLVDQPLDHPDRYLRPVGDAPWVSLAFALDWQMQPRQQQSPTWHYVQSDPWRYDSEFTDYDAVPEGAKWATGHAMDLEAMAVRMGWMPFFPQFKESSLEVAREQLWRISPLSSSTEVITFELGMNAQPPAVLTAGSATSPARGEAVHPYPLVAAAGITAQR